MRAPSPCPRLLATAALATLISLSACRKEAEPAPAPAPSAQVTERPAPAPQAPAPVVPVGRPTSFAPLVEQVKGAVVNVDVQARSAGAPQTRGGGNPFDEFFGLGQRQQPAPLQQGTGSGFIIDPSGRVVTNNHVIEGAVAIRVRLEDGRSFKARIVGRDPLTDVALLQLEQVEEPLPSVAFGDSDAIAVGDWVMAVGNPFGLASSVSAGIISARARDIHSGPYDDFLQTDAAINPGNSGGPLFNLAGEVIGINTAIIGGASGIGFAVPSNIARVLLPQLEQGVVRRGWLGVSVQELNSTLSQALGIDREHGALVADVSEGTPAGAAGLHARDVIVALDGKALKSARNLTQRVGFMPPGAKVNLTVLRDGKELPIEVTLGERPDFEGVGTGSGAQGAEARVAQLGLQLEDSAGAQGRLGPFGRMGRAPPGALVVQVLPGSAAERADLRPGMVIIEAAGQRITSARDLAAVLVKARSGQRVLLAVAAGRGGAFRALEIP